MHNDLIYDVGMNNGDDTAYYLHRGFRVLAIEANPALVAEASQRFQSEIDEERLKILNIGVAQETGSLEFWVCESNSAWSSFHKSIASRDESLHHSIEVPCQTFSSILETHGVPHYLKVDIEGNDRLCLVPLDPLDPPHYVSIELGRRGVEDLERLRALG